LEHVGDVHGNADPVLGSHALGIAQITPLHVPWLWGSLIFTGRGQPALEENPIMRLSNSALWVALRACPAPSVATLRVGKPGQASHASPRAVPCRIIRLRHFSLPRE
jgi:hypothetical protein